MTKDKNNTVEKIRDAALARALTTPHKPHKPLKAKKKKSEKKTGKAGAA